MSGHAEIFGESLEFPPLPEELKPGDLISLRRIVAGERALRLFYSTAAAEAEGDVHVLARLLRNDWDHCFGDLVDGGVKLLMLLGHTPEEEECLPSASEVKKAALSWAAENPPRFLEAATAFASRALICSLMVPWLSDAREVFAHFAACLEAEDRHLATVELFQELVEER